MGKFSLKKLVAATVNPTALIGTLLAPGASEIYGGLSANDAAKDQAAALNQQAINEQTMAATEAAAIRERARRVISQQRAALVDAGVRIDQGGSADAIQRDTQTLSEADALAALQTGAFRAQSLQSEAQNVKKQGKAAMIGGFLSGAGSFTQTGAMLFTGGK